MSLLNWIGTPLKLVVFFVVINLMACGGSSTPPPTTPPSATVNAISISPYQIEIANASSFQLIAVAYYSDNTSSIVTNQVNWSLQNNIANISSSGLITATIIGSSTITATFENVSSVAQLNVTAATLSSINIDPGSNSIANGTNSALHANGIYSDLTSQDLTAQVIWQSSDTAIATINTDGILTSQGVGNVTVTATLGAINNTTDITITAATLNSISVTPGNISIANGTSSNFQATGFYSDSSSQDLTSQVSWQSNDPAIADINSSGLLTSNNTGSTTVTASINGQTSSASITVTAAALSSINITPGQSSIANGTSLSFHATGLFTDQTTQDLTQQVLWQSDNNAVSDIDFNGLLSGNSVGSSIITASLGTISNTASVTITPATLSSISVIPGVTSIANGTNISLVANGIYSDQSTQNLSSQVTWLSGNSLILEVSTSGLVTARSVGSTTITANFNGQNSSSSITVTAAILISIEITPLTQSLPAGTTQAFSATGIYSDNSFQDITDLVTWISSNTTVATINNTPDNKGQLGSLISGQTNITASLSSISTTNLLTVTDAVLTSIDITPITSVISNGFSQIYTAVAHYSDGSINNVTNQVIWSTSDLSIANSNNSIIQSLQTGNVTVSANIGNVLGFASLTINSAVLQSITIDQLNVSIANGTQFEFTATGHYSDSSTQNLTNDVTWTSSSPQISTIQNSTESRGVSRGVSEGLSLITASYSGISNSTNLTVTTATLSSIALQTSNSTLVAGITQNIIATGTYSDNSTQDISNDVTWVSSDTSVAAISNAIDNKGEVIGYTDGNSTITASLNGVVSLDLILTIILDPNAAISISTNAFPNVILNNDSDITTITATVRPAAIGGVIPSTPIDFIVTDNGTSSTTTVNTINGVATLDITSTTEGFITVETQIQTSTLTSTTNLLSTENFSNVLIRALLFEPIYNNGSYLIGSRFGLYVRNLSNREFTISEFQALNDGTHLIGSPTSGSFFDDGILSAGEFIWAIYVVDTDITNGGVIGTRFFFTDPASGVIFGFGVDFTPPVQ